MSGVIQDVRYALRQLRKNPGFTGVAVLTLALGIGANTAIFSLVNTLMLHMLPVREPGQLVELLHRYPGEPHFNGFSSRAYKLMRDQNHVFSGLIAAAYQPFHVSGNGLEPQNVQGGYVGGNSFPVLGVKPTIGRLIGPDDDHAGNPSAVAVISWSYWRSRFNLDPAILGKQIMVEDVPVAIVGVAARNFSGLQVESRQDVWLPLALQPTIVRSGLGWGALWLVGRLKPGVSINQAQAEMAVLYESTLDEQARGTNNPFIRKMKLEMEPAGAGLSKLREEWKKPLLLLQAVVGLLLLLACTNLASMLLARGATREHEMALRLSLGAGHFRLARQVLTESLLLAAAGSLLGVYVAYFGAGVLARIITSERRPGPALDFHVRADTNVLLFTAAITLLTILLSGLVPALRAMRTAPASSLRQAGGTSEATLRRLFGKSLVVAQVALSVVLLSAAGLFVRHLLHLRHLDLGFHPDHVLLVTLDPDRSGYDDQRLSLAYQRLLERLEAIPGVRSATICAPSPISGAGANRGVTVEGYQAKPGEIRNVMESWVAPKYFATLGTPLLMGRDFSFRDKSGPRVAIINQAMAHYYFGNGDPLGMHVVFDGDHQSYEIVGVAGDAKYLQMREATLRTIYLNTFQKSSVDSQFALRISIDPEAVVPDVRRAVGELLKTVSVKSVTTLVDQIDDSIVPERLTATLSLWFGVLGALLAAIGLYGLLAYTVARRINEIGIRMALGATQGNAIWMVLGDALSMVCMGLAIGTPIAFWSARFAASLVPELQARSAVPIASGAVAMIAIALLAAYIPAQRAAKVDPMVALRYE
jgi:putative ABC transport system permease protein